MPWMRTMTMLLQMENSDIDEKLKNNENDFDYTMFLGRIHIL